MYDFYFGSTTYKWESDSDYFLIALSLWIEIMTEELRSYIFDHMVQDGEGRAFPEVNLVGNTSFLDDWQTQFIVFFVDVHGQDLW